MEHKQAFRLKLYLLRNNMKDKNKYRVIVFVLVSVIMLMSVVYATLSTTLNHTFGTVNSPAQTWEVRFTNRTIGPTESGTYTSTIGRSCASGETQDNTFTATAITLSKPGDKCVWRATIKNNGSLNAKLTQINATKPTSATCTISGASMVCGVITFKITTDSAGNTLLPVNTTTINAGSTLDVYVTAIYTGTDLSSSAVTYSNAKFQLVFTQN